MKRKREKHGMTKSREYRIWRNMLNRCYFKKSSEYKTHGEIGISVCEEWRHSFIIFFSEMGLSNGLSLDRIDNNGNYCKNNCRWANASQQALNTRRNVRLTYKGETLTIKEWNTKLGFGRGTIPTRLKYGWDINRIIETPSRVKSKNNINY